jgi:hypothetical protein
VIAEPLVVVGAVQETDAVPFPATAAGAAGAPGTPTVTAAPPALCAPVPIAFFAATWNV